MAPVPGYSYPGNYGDIPTDQRAHPSGITPGRLSLDTRPRLRTSSGNSGGRLSIDLSRSDDATKGITQSRNSCRIPMSLIQESNQAVDDKADDYLVDHPDEDEDEDANDANDDDDDGPKPSGGTTTSEKGK
ncbi:uncharacterized protein LOC107607113 [Arachis ipaensis]|uniref:uncharacterized protein LOC107607113 n=1 Tax=Arachis ipaensis TaxID=130454 RepID=UPI0007AFC94A|nr:uncharacterized protein LOC107607113 [Arachis ipaensis]XP_025664688.1 uncharacterized protein LOC112763162 [Arachis hypogaea]